MPRAMANGRKASELLERALAIWQAGSKPHPRETARALEPLALVERILGDPDPAISRLRSALEIDEELLGPEHADVARVLGSLAQLLEEDGKKADAKTLYFRAADSGEGF